MVCLPLFVSARQCMYLKAGAPARIFSLKCEFPSFNRFKASLSDCSSIAFRTWISFVLILGLFQYLSVHLKLLQICEYGSSYNRRWQHFYYIPVRLDSNAAWFSAQVLQASNSGSCSSITGFMSSSEVSVITVSGWKTRIPFPEKFRGFDICFIFSSEHN